MARRWDDSLEMEREFEERVEAKRKHTASRSRQDSKNKRKTPLLLRILAWCGVILLCFVAGYHGTSYMLDQPWFIKEGTSPASTGTEESEPAPDARLDIQKMTLSLFYPKNGDLAEEKADVIANTREDNIQEAVLKVLGLSGLFDDTVQVLHVFRNADTVYLNFSGAFIPALNKAGSELSTLLITGIVCTMRDNFSPISKVRFLVDSKVENAGSPVDLTATWQLPK